MFRSPADVRGSILILTIWSICFLSTLAVILGLGVRQKLQLVQRLDERDKLHLVAAAGINQAIARIRQDKESTFYSFQDICADDPSVFKEIALGEGRVDIRYDLFDEASSSRSHRSPEGEEPAGGQTKVRYGLIDEERKINVNTADAEVMERLFRFVLDVDEVRAQDLAASIVDWRDADSELSTPVGSAEDSFYRNLAYNPYEAKDAPLEALDELRLIKGMDANSMEKLKDYLTVFGDGKININTAPEAVLRAVGMSTYLVDKIMSYRFGKDGVMGTEDDNVFDRHSNIVPHLSQFVSLSDSEVADLTRIADQFLKVQSENFMARAAAHLNNRRNATEVVAVFNRSGDILYWHEF
ncbi:MAG: general secretion pathway protein GspK [Candidatus Omnitrophica bacterium]|nr:general secretion pathway protein GspK [Candidatus Omnitrophota bacterium]